MSQHFLHLSSVEKYVKYMKYKDNTQKVNSPVKNYYCKPIVKTDLNK